MSPSSPVAIGAITLSVIDGHPVTTSNDIARHFCKRHDHVLRDIQSLLNELPESARPNFGASEYTDSTGRNLPAYRITRDGFTLLAMGFTGKRALQFKLAYIDAFNQMEAELLKLARPARQKREPRQATALPAPRRIRSRDDLSFTKRDAHGRPISWMTPSQDWHQHYSLGEIWFAEVVELARHDPREAYLAMRFAGDAIARYWNYGHPDGFIDRMAHWALAAILANPTQPPLPFEPNYPGTLREEAVELYRYATSR